MHSIERATRALAKRRERRASYARLRHLRSTPSGRAILAHEDGQTVLTLTLAVDIAEFSVWAIHELVLPPDADHPHGSRWTLDHVTAAPTTVKTTAAHLAPDGIGGSWGRVTPTEPARNIYTFRRVPLSAQVRKDEPCGNM
jgi:hypothetical protein